MHPLQAFDALQEKCPRPGASRAPKGARRALFSALMGQADATACPGGTPGAKVAQAEI